MIREYRGTLRRAGAVWALLLALAGCGGGGSAGGDPPVDTNPPPPVTVSLTITGTAADGLLADARVQVSVGARTQTVAAAADGRYRADITNASEGDWVTLQVSSASRPDVALRSLAGRAGSLAGRAGATRTLDAAQWPALDVGAAATAATLTATRENAGVEPADEPALLALQPWLNLDETLNLAVAVHRGVALNVPPPTPGTGLLATLRNPSQAQAWFRAVRAADPLGLDQAIVEAIETLRTTAPAEAAAVAGQRVVYEQHGPSPTDALVIDYQAGGQAMVQMGTYWTEATWTRAADAVQITLLRPMVVSGFGDPDPTTGIEYPVTDALTGLTLRQLKAWEGVLRITRQGLRTYEDGPRMGITEPLVAVASTGELYRHAQLGSAQTLDAAEFASGTRWAGFIDSGETRYPNGAQGLFQFTTALAQAQGTGTVFSVMLTGNRLSLSAAGETAEYLRLRQHPVSGEQRWLRLDPPQQFGLRVATLSVRPVTGTPSFDAASIARRWSWDGAILRDLRGDLSGTETYPNPITADSPDRALSWTLAGGVVEMRAVLSSQRTRVRTWQSLGTSASGTWVLETLRDDRTSGAPTYYQRVTLQQPL